MSSRKFSRPVISYVSAALLVCLVLTFQNCGGFKSKSPAFSLSSSAPAASDGNPQAWTRNPAYIRWPSIYAQSGTYGIEDATPAEVTEMAGYGMHLQMGDLNDSNRAILQSNSDKVIEYFALINQLCDSQGCTDTPETEQPLLDRLQQHLDSIKNDPAIAGFWILDDNPGPNGIPFFAPKFLEKMHALIVQANQTSVVKRATFCGFAVGLEFDVTQLPPLPANPPGWDVFNNFTPNGCDFVVPYSYAGTSDGSMTADRVDWSMSRILPAMMTYLKARGWDPSKQPLVGMPGAFGTPWNGSSWYVTPARQNVATQISAFCKAGAAAIIPFIWDGGPPSNKLPITPSTNNDLKQGVIDGLKLCQPIWQSPFNFLTGANHPISFESGMEGFAAYGPAVVSGDSTEHYSGNSSLKIMAGSALDGGGNYGGAFTAIPNLTVGNRYSFSFRARAAADMNIVWSVQSGAGDSNCLSGSAALSTSWQLYTTTCQLDSAKPELLIYATTPNATFWIDDVQLQGI